MSIKDYHYLYLKQRFLLFADVFEKNIDKNVKNHGLCLYHYLSIPALSWNVMFGMIKFDLELIPDPDMYLFFEKDMRSGVFDISNRYNKASNKYFKSYDPKQESNILYT